MRYTYRIVKEYGGLSEYIKSDIKVHKGDIIEFRDRHYEVRKVVIELELNIISLYI